jgi:hypothetical protein
MALMMMLQDHRSSRNGKYFSVSNQIREVFFVFFVGRKKLLGSKHLAKAKTAKF